MDPGVVSMLSSRGNVCTIRNTLTQRLYYISGWSLRYMLTQGVYLQVGEIQVRISTVEQLQKLHQDSAERKDSALVPSISCEYTHMQIIRYVVLQ